MTSRFGLRHQKDGLDPNRGGEDCERSKLRGEFHSLTLDISH